MTDEDASRQEKLTFWQRLGVREIRRAAGKKPGEPLTAEDWAAAYEAEKGLVPRTVHALWRRLPSSPRCGRCGAPFAGPGRFIVRPLGYRPSRKNPNICATCVETSPPGRDEDDRPACSSPTCVASPPAARAPTRGGLADLRRFYRCAEDVLFPEAVIDKLIGDEVMALYLPDVQMRIDEDEVPPLMLEHARELLRAVGYGSAEGPFVEMGVGIDFGEAFVGNIGERAALRLHRGRRRRQHGLAAAGRGGAAARS